MIRLANRRFIPYYFDLSPHGAAGCAQATEFVVAQKPGLSGNAVRTPPVLFMTAEGELLAEVSNYASPEEVLAAMLAVLEAHPEYAEPAEVEQEVSDPIERAELLIDLCRDEEADEVLAQAPDSEQAVYLRARLARFAGDWERQEALLGQVGDAALVEDIRVEHAHRHWAQGDFAAMEPLLEGIGEDGGRYTESRYYLGLACFHQGRKEEAAGVWQVIVGECAQDPWVYRADWALSQVTGRSGLGRIGYMGNGNPDLSER